MQFSKKNYVAFLNQITLLLVNLIKAEMFIGSKYEVCD